MNITKQQLEVILFIEVLLVPIVMKLYNAYSSFNTEYISLFQIFAHDSIIIFMIILLTYISYILTIKIISIVLRIIALIIYLIYLIDYLILNFFATHLTIHDFIKFIDYVPIYISQEFKFDFLTLVLISSFVIIILLFSIKDFSINKKRYHFLTIGSLVFLFTINLFATNGSYIHSWIYKNVIEYNIEIQSQSRDYTTKFIDNFNYKENIKYIDSNITKKNIIILMVESLSSYQSQLFSGIKNWTPNIDKIAKRNIYFSQFYANGFVTEDAEISILTGLFPLYAPNIFSNGGGVSFKGFYNIKTSLPYKLKENGYETEFITSSDLKFSNTGIWAKSIGFDYIEGSKHKDYNGLTRYHFDAPADKFLYKRVLSRINKNKKNNFLIFVKTVSSHVPFINPENNNHSEEETIRYVDNEIGTFYAQLKKDNFFKNGILIIVGDHHPTMPVKQEAIDMFGIYKASAMTPMIISFGDKIQQNIKEPFQQTDIYHTLNSYLDDKISISNWIGNFSNLKNIISPTYIMHKRADRRGVVSIFNQKSKILNVILDGDNTRYIEKDIINDEIINKINFERIQRKENTFLKSKEFDLMPRSISY